MLKTVDISTDSKHTLEQLLWRSYTLKITDTPSVFNYSITALNNIITSSGWMTNSPILLEKKKFPELYLYIFKKQIYLSYWKGKITEGRRNRNFFHHRLVHSPYGHNACSWANPRPGVRNQELRILLSGYGLSRPWAVPLLLFQASSRELERTWNNQDVNWCSYGILALVRKGLRNWAIALDLLVYISYTFYQQLALSSLFCSYNDKNQFMKKC